eukprot:1191858-Prorocentrum_minimum.AAC.1
MPTAVRTDRSQEGRRYIPMTARIDSGRGRGVCSRRENQSREGRRYILRVRTNPRRGGGIYSAREPIAGGEAVYTDVSEN